MNGTATQCDALFILGCIAIGSVLGALTAALRR
jgi:hypothetical protein